MGKKDKLYKYAEELNMQVLEYDNYTNKAKLKDKDNYLYSLSADNIKCTLYRNGEFAKFFNGNPYSIENIKNYIFLNNIPIKMNCDTSNITSVIQPMVFNCCEHGDFTKSWNEIKNGQYCPICAIKNRISSLKLNIEYIREEFKKVGYKLITENYINNLQELCFLCPKHGLQKITWVSFISGGRCKECTKEERIRKQTKSHDEFINELNILYGDKFITLDEYKNAKHPIRLYCTDCNTEFEQTPNHLLEGHIGCKCKIKSLGENIIDNCLKDKGVIYKRQYRIKECKNIKPLPFDFAIFDKNSNLLFLIEFQGKQHYVNTGWSSDEKKSLEYFNKQQINDNIKRNFCKENSINLLEIPYWEISKIKTIINNALDREVN